MKIIDGTKQTQELFRRLTDDGDLVDVYSKSFYDRQPSHKDEPYADFSKEGFEYFLEEYENNPECDIKPLNHLLFIHVDDYKKDVHKALIEAYRPLEDLIDTGKHSPDFLLINLYTRQVLCVGFGRKNRLFIIDAETGKLVDAFGLLGLHASGLHFHKNSDYIDKFTEHDIYETVSDFLHALHTLSVAMFEYDNMPANQEEIENTIDLGPNENGAYQLKNWIGEVIDEEEYSKEEMDDMLKEINDYQIDEDESMRVVKIFFPQCERCELNTGDY